MPWDHINKVINRSLPLQQPSKAASSHSSICTNSRQRSPGLRKPHLLSCCFYLSPHCISCQDCRSEKAEISLYLFMPWRDQRMCLRWNPTAPALWCKTVWGRECCRSEVESKEKYGWALVAVHHQQSRLTPVRVGAGAQTSFPITSEKASIPASQDTWRTWPCLSWAFQSMSQHTPPKHCCFILASQIPGISLVILLAQGRILCTPGVFWGIDNLWENEVYCTFLPFFLFCCYRGCSHTFSKS